MHRSAYNHDCDRHISIQPSKIFYCSHIGARTTTHLHTRVCRIKTKTDSPPLLQHGMIVVPVIGILYDKNAFNPAPNAAEVEAIFDAPLEMFLKVFTLSHFSIQSSFDFFHLDIVNCVRIQDENRTEEEREWMGNKYLLHFFDYEAENKKYVIWALTAGILITAASLVYQKQPAFSERKPKFWTTSHQ